MQMMTALLIHKKVNLRVGIFKAILIQFNKHSYIWMIETVIKIIFLIIFE